MENHLSWEAKGLSHSYEILRLLLIPKVHCHVHNSLTIDLYTAMSIQSAERAIRFNLILPSVPLSPNVLILSVSQPNLLRFLNSIRWREKVQHSVKHWTGSFYAGHPVVFKCECIKERSSTVYIKLYRTYKKSYMFRLYECSLHQAEYRNLN